MDCESSNAVATANVESRSESTEDGAAANLEGRSESAEDGAAANLEGESAEDGATGNLEGQSECVDCSVDFDTGMPCSSMSRKSNRSKHLVGYKKQWEKEFSWLLCVYEVGKAIGMMCRLCKRHHTKNKYNQSTVWSVTPCICLRKDSVRRHSKSAQYLCAVELESCRLASVKDGGIRQAFQLQASLQRKAVKGAMQCLYWLVKSEIPHTTKYGSLVDTVQFMGCDYFKHLHQGENAKYKSQRIISEFLQVMAHQIEKKQLQDLLSATFYSIMIDEMTDIAVLNEMVLYARYLSPRDKKVTLSFLKICQLGNGLATTIESTLLAYFEEKGIAVTNMVGFGSDGARVMTGRNNGVGAKLKQRQPSLTCVHCVCHHLALAASHAGKDVPYIRLKFKPTLSQLFYFYQNSSVRMSGLQAIERLLQCPELKLKKPADTRWLSHDSACQTLVKVFPCSILQPE